MSTHQAGYRAAVMNSVASSGLLHFEQPVQCKSPKFPFSVKEVVSEVMTQIKREDIARARRRGLRKMRAYAKRIPWESDLERDWERFVLAEASAAQQRAERFRFDKSPVPIVLYCPVPK